LYRKIQLTETLLQKVIQRKLRLFGHICRMNDSRKIKTLVFGIMDGSNKRGRPHREWSDDIEQWCGTTLQKLSHAALDRQRWAAIVRMASDTNGHWAHGCRWWWWLLQQCCATAQPVIQRATCICKSKFRRNYYLWMKLSALNVVFTGSNFLYTKEGIFFKYTYSTAPTTAGARDQLRHLAYVNERLISSCLMSMLGSVNMYWFAVDLHRCTTVVSPAWRKLSFYVFFSIMCSLHHHYILHCLLN